MGGKALMANTNGYTRVQKDIFKKVKEGTELSDKQTVQLKTLLKGMGYTLGQPQPQPQPQPQTVQQTVQTESINQWKTFTDEQKELYKAQLIKSKNGDGGENISIFPNLIGAEKTNPFINSQYGIIKPFQQNKFNSFKGNGEIIILPLEVTKFHFLTIILPNKDLQLDLWELSTDNPKEKTKYTTHKLNSTITVKPSEYIITNIQTNSNKTWNNGKLLSSLLNLYYNTNGMESVKAINSKKIPPNIKWLKKDLNPTDGTIIYKEYTTNTHKPTGKTFKSIGEYLGKEYSKAMEDLDLTEFLN